MRRSLHLLLSLALALLCCLVANASAQTSGEITGLVTDSSGAVVSGASVTVTNKATGAARQVTTNSEELYSFPSLLPGAYELKVEQAGFKTARLDNVTLEVQQTARLDVKMEVGQVGETLTITSAGALLNAETATVGTVIENKIVTELPLNGRQYLNLVALSPNVNVLSPSAGQAGSRQGGDRASQAISTGGQRIFFDYYTLDGVNNTDPNFNSYIALPSIDAIQEFKVQTGVYPAEYGHQSTQVNVLTKSGGNAYHGALFEFLRNDVLDAQPYAFTSVHPKKSPFKWNDYGYEFDGSVRIPHLFNGRDRLFFMSNYEALRRRQTSLATFSVPTAKMFNGDFSELTTPIYDPLTQQPFPGNIIPTSRLDPISLKLLKYYNSATLPGLTNNYVQNNSAPLNRDGFVIRLDFVESSKSQWMGRYNWGDENQSTQGINLAGSKILTNYEQYTGSNTRTITENLVNEARFGYSRFFNSLGALLAFNTDVVSEIGIPGQSSGAPVTWGIPNMGFSGAGFTGIGDANDGPFANDNNTLQFVEKLSWLHGKHSFAFGFEYNRQNYNQIGNQFSRGLFSFQANSTRSPQGTGGNAFAEFLLGNIFTSTNAVAIADAKFQRNVVHAFIDDTWKVTPKLTLSLGLRYELTPPFTNTRGDYFTVKIPKIEFVANAPQADWPFFVRQGNCTDPYQGLNIRWTNTQAVCGGGLNNNLLETKYKNFAPRVGIAYGLNDKTVIRAGFGVFYMQDIGNAMYFDLARNIAARVTLNSNIGTPTLFWNNAIPGGNGAVAQVPPPYAFTASYDHATSYTMQYLLNVQRQFGNDWVLEAGYLGSVSRHLYGFQNLNQAVPGTTGSVGTARGELSKRAFAEPDPNFYIYLCFGQSNMEGGGRIEELDRMVDPRFRVLADFDVPNRDWKKGQWYTAVPPLTRRTRGISLVDYFGRTMVANLPKNIRVGVVKVGVSGTKIELWDKDSYREYLATADAWKVNFANEYGGNPYAYLVELAKIAQKDGVIKGILLHQGESNAEDQDWPRKVKVVYDNLMKDLNLKPESTPLLAGEVVNADQGGEKASANEIIKKLPETLPNSYIISSAGLPCNADHLHFTAEGYKEFGRRYAEKMLAVLGYKIAENKAPTTPPAAGARP